MPKSSSRYITSQSQSQPSYLRMFLIVVLILVLLYIVNSLYENRQKRKQSEIEEKRKDELKNKNSTTTTLSPIQVPLPVVPTRPSEATPSPTSPTDATVTVSRSTTPTPTAASPSIGVFTPNIPFEPDCEKKQDQDCASSQKRVNQNYDILRMLSTRILGKGDANDNVLCFKNQKSLSADSSFQLAQREKNINIIANEAIMKSMIEGNFENLGRLYLLINKVILDDGRSEQSYIFTAYDNEEKEMSRISIANGTPIKYVTIKRGRTDLSTLPPLTLKNTDVFTVYQIPNSALPTTKPGDVTSLTDEYSNFKVYILGTGPKDAPYKSLQDEITQLRSQNPDMSKFSLAFFGRFAVYLYNILPGVYGRRGLLKMNVNKKVKYDPLKLADDRDGSYRRQLIAEFKNKKVVNTDDEANSLLDKVREKDDSYVICS